MLQCIAVRCSVLRCGADREVLEYHVARWCVLQRAAVRCSVAQCVVVCGSVLQCVEEREALGYNKSPLQRVAVWYSVLQCVAECCSVLQCVAVCCSVLQYGAD